MEENRADGRRKLNLWMWAFLLLVALLIGGAAYLVYMVTAPVPGVAETPAPVLSEEEPTFSVSIRKNQANALIHNFLEPYRKDSPVAYDFVLEEQAKLTGVIPVFGLEVDFHLLFEPYALENGDVLLQTNSLSVGMLSLPLKEILQYVQRHFVLPEFVSVDAQKEGVILHLSQFKMKDGSFIRAGKLDLANDVIEIDVYYKGDLAF